MGMMDRIQMKTYLEFTQDEKEALILKIRALREGSLAEARVKKCGGRTKSATANIIKRGGKIKDPAPDLLKALGKLDPSALAKIKSMFNN